MFDKIRKKLKNRKLLKIVNNYRKGFDHTAGLLLRKEMTPCKINSYIEVSKTLGKYDSFDQGCKAAIDLLVNLQIVEDDRI